MGWHYQKQCTHNLCEKQIIENMESARKRPQQRWPDGAICTFIHFNMAMCFTEHLSMKCAHTYAMQCHDHSDDNKDALGSGAQQCDMTFETQISSRAGPEIGPKVCLHFKKLCWGFTNQAALRALLHNWMLSMPPYTIDKHQQKTGSHICTFPKVSNLITNKTVEVS